MTVQQGLSFAVLAGTMALFVWGRWRYDLVAVTGLLAAVLVGVVPSEEAFSGFANDIVVIVGSALVVSAAVARSGVIERAVGRVAPWLTGFRSQLLVLIGAVALMSAFVKNIGALAIMMPIAFQMARRSGTPISRYLMPMAFASLLGGLMTLVGTSPNVIVAGVREDLTGEPFAMFDYLPVGAALTAAGLAFLAFGYRLLPSGQTPAAGLGEALDAQAYLTEARVPPGSPAEGKSIADLGDAAEGVSVAAVLRAGEDHEASCDTVLRGGDIVLLQGAPDALERTIAKAALELEGQDRIFAGAGPGEEIGVIEAVVAHGSILIGEAAGRLALHRRHDINLLAVGRSGVRFTERLRGINLRAGDVIVLQGVLSQLPGKLQELGCLPLAEREVRLGNLTRSILPLAILAVAMVLTALGLVSVPIAFFGAAAATVMIGALPLREAYAAVDWPILVMLAALIPVSGAIQQTGGTELIAEGLSQLASGLSPLGAVALILVAAMALTPFLNNAATVLVMAPIAAGFATQLGYRPDAFLMAVAVGAACDFLTPIGHQCNTLVMGPGGYRFGDYWRLGLPLSLLVVAMGVPLIALVWPV
ncbi:MAG: SLC13 family permease [Sphingomonadales bacterium 32-68-7]|nr:MAG: SLC13 family permease [Sphingomonadales bacterium 12-68-11]OYX10023.1 MAG: SLC13 family permease [Sphingomonadales bacterium 32-68-7]